MGPRHDTHDHVPPPGSDPTVDVRPGIDRLTTAHRGRGTPRDKPGGLGGSLTSATERGRVAAMRRVHPDQPAVRDDDVGPGRPHTASTRKLAHMASVFHVATTGSDSSD